MKFISVVALLAPVGLAAAQGTNDGWIGLLQEKCPDMPAPCLDIAKKVHEPQFDGDEATQAAQDTPACNPIYAECVPKVLDDGSSDVPTFPQRSADQEKQCLLQIAPDHFKYFLDNDSAEIPIPSSQNCELRELHRAAHVALGPLA